MSFFIKDTEIKIGFLFAASVAALLCFDVGPQVQLSVISGILHEGGHVFSLLLLGERPQKICFGLFGLTVLRRNDIKLNYKNEIITAFCGPFVNIAICVCALLFLSGECLSIISFAYRGGILPDENAVSR